MWSQFVIPSAAAALLLCCGPRTAPSQGVSDRSPPAETPDLTLHQVAFARLSDGRVVARSDDIDGVVDVAADATDDPRAVKPLWGRAVDRLGARPILVLCSFGIAAVPALWLFVGPDFLWPLAMEAAASGALWAGHGIASMSLTLKLPPADRRPYYVAVFGATSGLGFGAASVVAGLVAAGLPAHFDAIGTSWTSIHVLFLASSVARALAAFTALHIEEGDARPLGAVARSLAGQALAAVTLRRLPS